MISVWLAAATVAGRVGFAGARGAGVGGFAGSTGFDDLAAVFAAGAEEGAPIGVIIGLVFIIAGLAFKVSAVPFHMWTPDVYEGAPTPVTAFFAVAPKIAAMALFVRVMLEPFGGLFDLGQIAAARQHGHLLPVPGRDDAAGPVRRLAGDNVVVEQAVVAQVVGFAQGDRARQ